VGWLSAAVVGSTAAAALAVNNHRDRAHDQLVGRRTFAARFGAQASTRLLALLLALPYAVAVLMAWLSRSAWPLTLWVLLPHSWALFGRFRHAADGADGADLNAVLFGIFRLGLVNALLWSGALVALRPTA
jgi:1,4-dihydroxy-2-naphthoate octaprenyltransferase